MTLGMFSKKTIPLLTAVCLSFFCAREVDGYEIFVSNEKSGDLTVISGETFQVVTNIPVGKFVCVALSATPIEPPPLLDAHGNPILKKNSRDDDEQAESDKSADGIG